MADRICPKCGSRALEDRPDAITKKVQTFCARCGHRFEPLKQSFMYTLPGEKEMAEKKAQEEDICAAAVYAAMDVLKTQCGTFCEKRRIDVGGVIVEMECPAADLTLLREDTTLTVDQKRRFVRESQWAKDFTKKMLTTVAVSYPESSAEYKTAFDMVLEKIAIGVVG